MTNLGRENGEREFKESTTEVEKGIISLQRGNPDPYRHEGISELYAGRYIGFHGIAQIVHRQNGTEATLQRAGGKDRFQKKRGMDRPLRRMIPDERGLGGRHTLPASGLDLQGASLGTNLSVPHDYLPVHLGLQGLHMGDDSYEAIPSREIHQHRQRLLQGLGVEGTESLVHEQGLDPETAVDPLDRIGQSQCEGQRRHERLPTGKGG